MPSQLVKLVMKRKRSGIIKKRVNKIIVGAINNKSHSTSSFLIFIK
jgi:hypothetical protein